MIRRFQFLSFFALLSMLLPGVVQADALPRNIVVVDTHLSPETKALLREADIDQDSVVAAIEVQERHSRDLLTKPGVQGSAVGWQSDGKAVIKIYTDASTAAAGLPAQLEGVPVVVETSGPMYALNIACPDRADGVCDKPPSFVASSAEEPGPDERHPRPVPIGVSIGHEDVFAAGTLACRVFAGCHNYALGNAHVIADENAGVPGDHVLQPGVYDGGIDPSDTIGYLYQSVPIDFSFGGTNTVDAAIAITTPDDVGHSTPSDGYGRPRTETVSPAVNLDVMKYGRTSAMTHGYIDAINAVIWVTYDAGNALFVDQIMIKPDTGPNFSSPGDSGALVVIDGGADDRKPVGLVFASANGVSAANPIDTVLNEFGVSIDGD